MSKTKDENEILKEVFQNLANYFFECSKVNNFDDFKMFLPNFVKNLIDDEKCPEWKEIPDAWIGKPIKKRLIDDIITSNNSLLLEYLIQKDNKSFRMFKANNSNYSDNDLISIISKVLDIFFISQSDQYLVDKISRYLKDTDPILQIRNMTKSWINGVPLIALISKASNGTINFVDKNDPTSNYNFIKESFQVLKIPFVLTEDCISRGQQIKICNRIQTALFFKSINFIDYLEAPKVLAVQNTTENQEILKSTEQLKTEKTAEKQEIVKKTENDQKRQEDIKKFEKKIEEYNDAIQATIKLIETEQTKLEKLSKCCLKEDINTLRNFCHTFIKSEKAKYQQQIFKINNDLWDVLLRRSQYLKIPIPEDLIKIEEVKQKFDCLVEAIKIKSENIDSEEIKINKYYEEIKNINNIIEARKKYNELKEQYDIDKWSEFNTKSFIFILGEKLQSYENSLKYKISVHENLIKQFEELHKSINNEIQQSTEDLNAFDTDTIQKYIIDQNKKKIEKIIIIHEKVRSLETTYEKIKDYCYQIKMTDPNIEFSYEHFQLLKESDIQLFYEFRTKKFQEKENTEKYAKYINDYQSSSQNMINSYDNDQNHIECFKNIYTIDDIKKIKEYINIFNITKTERQKNIQSIETNWINIEQLSNSIQIPVPEDLIKIEEVKQKFDCLVEAIKIKSENIINEEIQINKYYEEIKNINNIIEARKKYNELKEQYDIDKWSEFNTKSFIFILGEKLQSYENSLKYKISVHENLIKQFEELHKSINNEIQQSTEDLISLQNSVSKLNIKSNDIEYSINNIKQIDPSFQNDISEFQLKIESDNVKFKEFINNKINELIEKEFNTINELLKNVSFKIKDLSKYDNQYSADLYSKVNEHHIIFPNYSKLENLLTFISDNSEWQVKTDEIKKLIESNKQDYDKKIKDIQIRQDECSIIENELNELKNKWSYITRNFTYRELSFNSLKEINALINIAKNKKNWNENSIGTTIDLYNESMSFIFQKMNEYSDEIKNTFIFKLDTIKNLLEEKLIEYTNSSIIKEHAYYIDKMNNIRTYQSDLDYMKSINELIKLNINMEIDESETKINEAINLVQQKIDSIQLKIEENIDLTIANYNTKLQKEKDDLISKSKNEYYTNLNDDSREIKYQLYEFNEFINELTSHIKKYKLNINLPNTDEIKETYLHLYIIYKSSLLLNPKERLGILKQNFKDCENQNVTICACLLYVNIFRNKKYDFDIKEDDLLKIEGYAQFILASYFPFGINILREIQKNIIIPLNECTIYDVEILSESIKYLDEPELYMLNSFEYLYFPIIDNDHYEKIKLRIEKNLKLTKNDQLIEIISKFSSLLIESKDRKIRNESVLLIDFGSFKQKILYFKNGDKKIDCFKINLDIKREDLSYEEILKEILEKHSNNYRTHLVFCIHEKKMKKKYH